MKVIDKEKIIDKKNQIVVLIQKISIFAPLKMCVLSIKKRLKN